ncbi:MAG: hypothetical protein R6W48_11795 [Gaiellaceae bacterium]
MEHRISVTELARSLDRVLERVRGGDAYVVEQGTDPIARFTPVRETSTTTLREAFAAWRAAGEPDLDFADALERVNRTAWPSDDSWRL